MDAEELVARAEISDVLDDYAYAIDTRDFDLVASVFTADAVLDYTSAGGPSGQRDDVVGWLADSLPAVTLTQHVVTNRRIRVDGDAATVRSELLNPLLFDGETGTSMLLLGGRYDDTLRRTPEGWRITHRVHATSWTAGPVPARLQAPEG